MDEKDLELEMLNLFEESMKDIYQNEYQKLWRYEFRLPLSFKDALGTLNKDELTKIRQNLNLKGLSTLNKTELIDKLVIGIPDCLGSVFNKFDDHRYNFMKSIITNGGHLVVDPDDFRMINYFRYYGIAVTGWKGEDTILTIPAEVIEVFNKHDTPQYRGQIEKNTMWINLTKGLLFYHGILDFDYIIEKLETYTHKECGFFDVFEILYEACEYYVEMEYTEVGLKDTRVVDEHFLREEQLMREDIPYHEFTKAQILRASHIDYIDRTAQTNEFTKYLKENYHIDNNEIDGLLGLIYVMINNDSHINEILEMIQGRFPIESFEDFQDIASLLMNIYNNTRQWILKGNTPTEASKITQPPPEEKKSNVIDLKTRKKIGRNDPCPCGSGKKYKRCCGKA